MAYVISSHAWVVFFSKAFFADLLVLAALTWSLVKRAQSVELWTRVPVALQQRGRFAAEVYFGLLNPVLYLAVLSSGPQMVRLRNDSAVGGWVGQLHAAPVVLLAAVWGWRFYGSAFRPELGMDPAGLRLLPWISLACLLLFTLKDLTLPRVQAEA